MHSLHQHVAAGLDPVAADQPRGRMPIPQHLQEVDVPHALPAEEGPTVAGILEAPNRHRIETLVLTSGSPRSCSWWPWS